MIVFSREFLLSPVRYTGMYLSYNKHSNSYNAPARLYRRSCTCIYKLEELYKICAYKTG